MKNLKISVPTVDGSSQDFEYANGKELIEELLSDDWGAPPTAMVIEATADDGKTVRITIPYSKSDKVHVKIGEK